MAKYNITYSCGHEGTVQLFGKNEERDRKIKYYEEFGLCPECYKKQKQEEDAKLGLLIGGSVEDTLSDKGEIQIRLFFAGDTLPHKEEIKALGYRWTTIDSSQIAYIRKPDMGWVKVIPYERLKEEKEKAFAIGAKDAEVSDRELIYQKTRYQEMLSEQRLHRFEKKLGEKTLLDTTENREKQQMYEEKLRNLCPVEPDVIRGKYWNEKVYGKQGRYSIYPDSKKLAISDEEAAALKKYLSDRAEYRKTKKEMKEEGFAVPAWA